MSASRNPTLTIKLRGGVIAGRFTVDAIDPQARIVSGAFRPGLGYSLIEPIFDLGRDPAQRERYDKALDALALEVQDDAGTPLDVGRVEILGTAATSRTLVARIEVLDPGFWTDR